MARDSWAMPLRLPTAAIVVVLTRASLFAESPMAAEQPRITDWLLLWATLGLVIVTAMLALYTALLYRSTKKMAFDADATGKEALRIGTESAKAAKQSADAARATLIVAHRPWVQVTVSLEPNSEWSLIEENGQAQLHGVAFVRIKNIGQTPARNVHLWTATLSADKERALEMLKSFADADRSEVHKDRPDQDELSVGRWARYTLFPGEERVAKELVRTSRPRDPFGYCFAGLVGYRHSLESEPCHTTFSFTLFRKGPLYSKLLTLGEQVMIPTAEIELHPDNADDGLTT
jgi:hypothetical protein